MSISLLFLTLALTTPGSFRAQPDTSKPLRPVVRPASPPRPVAQPKPGPASKPVGEPVLKRRRPPM